MSFPAVQTSTPKNMGAGGKGENTLPQKIHNNLFIMFHLIIYDKRVNHLGHP